MTQPPTPVLPAIHEDDKALAEAVAGKDRKATAEFVEQHADPIYAYVLARVRPNDADAEDVTQEVFLAACRSITEYRGAASLRAWLFGIARHKIEDYYRVRVHLSELEAAAATLSAEATSSAEVELDSALDESRLRERTAAALDRLPEQYRLLLKWRYWDQQATAAIASTLGRTEKAVERMLARARERFRREWEAEA